MLSYSRNYEVNSMGIGTDLYIYNVVVKSSSSLSHLLMTSCNVHVIDLSTLHILVFTTKIFKKSKNINYQPETNVLGDNLKACG